MRRLRVSRALLIAMVVVVLAELAVRALAPHLPEPLVWDSPWTQEKAGQIERLRSEGGVDVAFTGSSVVQSALDGDLLAATIGTGITAYNAGLPGATVRVWREWARDVVHPGLCPAVLVIGVTVRDYNDAGAGSGADRRRYLDSAGRRGWRGELSTAERIEEAVAGVSTLFEYRSILRRPAAVARWLAGGSVEGWERMMLTDRGRNVGFDDRSYRLDPERREAIRTRAFADFAVGGPEERALRRMVATAREFGALPVIVEMPVMEADLVPLLPGGAADLGAFRDSLQRVATATGTHLLRFDELVDRPELFADEYHVNGAGMRAVTSRLAEELAPLLTTAPGPSCGD